MKKFITGKGILAIGFILLIVGTVTGWYIFNKGPEDVKHSSGMYVNAQDLYDQFINDSLKAHGKYAGKILAVNGQVSGMNKNNEGAMVILLKSGTPGANINCTMEEAPQNTFKSGEIITVKGICTGIGQGDAEMGIMGDVYLTRCYIKK